MTKTSRTAFLWFGSDNRKSKACPEPCRRIQNPKWGGGFAIAFALTVCGARAEAQQPGKVPHVAYLSTVDSGLESARAEAIRLAMREIRYIEGKNITTEYRYADGKVDRFSELTTEPVRLKVDIILVAGGSIYVQAAKNATKTIPIIMTGAGIDPVGAGLVETLARPGGNVTGLTILTRELDGKQLELFKEAIPKLARVAALYNPAALGSVRQLREDLPVAARALGLTIQLWEVRDTDGFERVFAELSKERPHGLYVLGGTLTRSNENQIVGFALKSRLPSIYFTREFVDAGGLMSYGAERADSFRRVATYVDRILKGAKPADLPVERPTKFELVINLKTAKQIDVTIAQKLVARGDRVIR